jgi:DHA1 family tetracycline resistance protein-like MFS transporter
MVCKTSSTTLHLPFIVAACLSAFSITCTYMLLPKEPPTGAQPVDGPGGRRPSAFDWRVYAEYFGRPQLRALYIQFFLFSFGFSCFFSGFALFAEHNPYLRWGADEVGYLFAYAGLLGIFLQGGLLGRLVKRFGELRLTTLFAFVAATVAYTLIGLSQTVLMIVVAITVSTFGHGLLRPVLTSRLTQAVGRHEQGVVLDPGSLSSVAMVLAPPTGGAMLDRHWIVAWALIPAAVSVIGLLFTLVRPGAASPAGDTRGDKLHSEP